jgi:hypothetical protein
MSNPTLCVDRRLYHNNDVQTLADFFFKIKDEITGKSLMLLFKGVAPTLQDWVNTIIALRNITQDKNLKTDKIKSLASKVQSDATTVLQTTRPC